VASPILSISGLLLIFSGLGSGRLLALSELEFPWLAISIDLLPIVLGVLAAGLLGASVNATVRPGQLHAGESEMQASTIRA
jgi:hypothetical protein